MNSDGRQNEPVKLGKSFFEKGISMKSCTLTDFIGVLEPWLSGDYIRKVSVYENKVFEIYFTDGVIDTYNIDDCTRSQFQKIIDRLEKKGIPIENQ